MALEPNENLLVDYAFVLCTYGEESQQDREFLQQNATEQTAGKLLEVAIKYRMFKG